MKSKLHLVLIFALVAFVCLLGWKSSAQTSNKFTWEYKIYTTYGSASTTQLNVIGTEGWELVDIRSEDTGSGGADRMKVEYYFKRMK